MLKIAVSLAVASLLFQIVVLPAHCGNATDNAVARGIDAIRAHNYGQAINEFTYLISQHPESAEYYALRGSAYYDSKDYLKAQTDFADAIYKGKKDHVMYQQLNNSVAHNCQSQVNTAGLTALEVIKAGMKSVESGDYPKAVGLFTAVINKEMPNAVQQAAYGGRAEAFLKMNRKVNARLDALSLIALGNNSAGAKDLLARASAPGGPRPAGFRSLVKPSQNPDNARPFGQVRDPKSLGMFRER